MPARAQSVSIATRLSSLVHRMDWYRGLRAASALCVPQMLGVLLGNPNLSWSGLGGFEAIFADSGGPYRIRLETLFTVAFGGALGLALGTLAGTNFFWALPLTVAFCFLWSYIGVLGQPFSSAGNLVLIIYFCGIGAPSSSVHEALTRGLYLMIGGLWAALLSLILWPLDAYRPARSEVATCYQELASFLASIAELAAREHQSAALWHRLAQHHQYRIRGAIERGWNALAAARASRQAETPQGQQLVVLLEHADLLVARSIAIAESLESPASATERDFRSRALSSLADLRAVQLWIADLLARRTGRLTMQHAQAERGRLHRLPHYLENALPVGDQSGRFLLSQIAQSVSVLDSSVDSAAQLRLDSAPDRAQPIPAGASTTQFAYVYSRLSQFRERWSPARIAEQLAANFTPGSLLLRHAARVTIVCGIDVVLIFAFHIDHGYWMLLTSLIVLQPHVSGTMRRGLERIAGTVGGGALAALIALGLHSQITTTALLFPLALLTLALLPVNYTACAFFLTPTFVLAWMPYSGDWQLAMIRTGNTIAGALLSLAAMTFLFPTYERERAPLVLRTSLAANRRYLAQLVDNWRTGTRGSRLLANARRSAALAHNDAEESLERLLAESWPRRPLFAQFVTALVTYLRRATQSVTVLAAIEGDAQWKHAPVTLARMDLAVRRLTWLEAEAASAPAAPWPAPATELVPAAPPEFHPGERQLQRLERQVEILRRQLHSLRTHGGLRSSV
jgi:uncharacterized membrane protein YccC